jgi:periplasmic divalent cation tolerance protein
MSSLVTPASQYNNFAQSTTRKHRIAELSLEKMPTNVVLVLTTAPDEERAEALARTLVDERLAACVNVHGSMTSFYRWKGTVQREAERQLIIKTTRDRLPALEERLKAIHPYELPELLVLPVEEGSDAYSAWVSREVAQRPSR